jgi:cellulose synthase/poly-beta-1,6-N-acetylglucosamine synthase-like glycosyltransferase
MSRVNIITRSFNRLEYTILNVRNTYEMANQHPYTHIIVEQNSSDGTKEWLKSMEVENFYPLKIQYNEINSGDAGGMYDGFKICDSDCEYVMQLDNDIHPVTENFIEKLVGIMDSDPKIGGIMLRRLGVGHKVNLMKPCKTINGVTLCKPQKLYSVFYRKELLEKINYWVNKERIGWVFQISNKINQMGFEVLKTHDIEMIHVDGYRDVVKQGTEQAYRYPNYFKTIAKVGTNYKTIKY